MRKCVKCNLEKREEEFYHKPNGGSRGRFCKSCESKRCMKRYYGKHDEMKKKAAEYRKRNKNIIKKRAALARSKYNHSAYSAGKMKEYRRLVKVSYVKARLRALGIKNEDITSEMIDEMKVRCAIERIKDVIEKTGIKICDGCGKKKPIKDFYQRQWWWNGLKKYSADNICKECSKIRNRRYHKNERHRKPKKPLV